MMTNLLLCVVVVRRCEEMSKDQLRDVDLLLRVHHNWDSLAGVVDTDGVGIPNLLEM